jgi:hypothetical protein
MAGGQASAVTLSVQAVSQLMDGLSRLQCDRTAPLSTVPLGGNVRFDVFLPSDPVLGADTASDISDRRSRDRLLPLCDPFDVDKFKLKIRTRQRDRDGVVIHS